MANRDETKPLVTAVGMGYGHLRAAQALADGAGVELIRGDDPGLVGPREAYLWTLTRRAYETVTRLSQDPRVGGPFRKLVESATDIPPPYPFRDLSAPVSSSRMLGLMIDAGLGQDLARRAKESGRPLLTTFYSQALAAERHGADRVACVVTDTDIHRIWAPLEPGRTRIMYLAPSKRVVQRLTAYGVPAERIRYTGFPLPPELLGGPDLPVLKRNLAARIVRLDPEGAFIARTRPQVEEVLGPLPMEEQGKPPRITVAVGGAGAQTAAALALLNGIAEPLRRGLMRLTLVAGVRSEVAQIFRVAVAALGLPERPGSAVDILYEPDFLTYYRRFNAVLAETDVLWTKPSEMVFYAALGIPLVLASPVGRHEAYNKRWAMDRGAALRQRALPQASGWMREWMEEGVLAQAAWSGFRYLPQRGTYRILEAVGEAPVEAAPAAGAA